MKKIISVFLAFAMILSLSGCCSVMGHKEGEWVTTVEPDIGTEGERTKTCTVCNELLETEPIEAIPAVSNKSFNITPRLFESRLSDYLPDFCTVEGSNLSGGQYCIKVNHSENNLVCQIVFTYNDDINNYVEDVDATGYDTIAINVDRNEIGAFFLVVRGIVEAFEPTISEEDKSDFVTDKLLDMIINLNKYSGLGRIEGGLDYVSRNSIRYVMSVSSGNSNSEVTEIMLIQAE